MSVLNLLMMPSLPASAAGLLTVTQTPGTATTNITGSTAYNIHAPTNGSLTAYFAKKGTDISDPVAYGTGSDNSSISSHSLSWTDSTSGNFGGQSPSGSNSSSGRSRIQTNAGSEAGISWTCLANTTSRVYRVYCGSINFSGNTAISCRATLSDGSASAVTSTKATSGDLYFEVTVKAGSASQTVQIDLFPGTSSAGAQYAFVGVVEV